MNNKAVFAFIPIGVGIVAGGIQTAIVAFSFSASQWYIAGLLIICVWITAAMDASAFHHSATAGATWQQKIFLALSAISLVVVLSVDLVWMFNARAFETSDAIIKDLSYATGINLAVSAFCLLAWIFFSQDHTDERTAATMEAEKIRDRRLAYLETPEAQKMIDESIENEFNAKISRRNRKYQHVTPNTKKETPQPFTQEQVAQMMAAWQAQNSALQTKQSTAPTLPPQDPKA